jgi:CspA family cold shock protein
MSTNTVAPNNRERGVVKWFSAPKGFGFIIRENGRDIFVHHSQIQMDGFRTLDDGQAVEFEARENASGKGLEAVNVRPVGE